MTSPLPRIVLGITLLSCAGCVVVPTGEPESARQAAAPPPREYCREYQQTVTIGGQLQQAHGTSCQQPDGTWRLATAPRSQPAPAATYPASSPPYYGAPYIVVPVGPPDTGSEDRR